MGARSTWTVTGGPGFFFFSILGPMSACFPEFGCDQILEGRSGGPWQNVTGTEQQAAARSKGLGNKTVTGPTG